MRKQSYAILVIILAIVFYGRILQKPLGIVSADPQSANPPIVSGFAPSSGAAGANVTIVGEHFTGATDLKFGNVSASFTLNSDSRIAAIVPANAVTAPISVTTAAGTGTSKINFTITGNSGGGGGGDGRPPNISGFSPKSGAPGITVSVAGTNFVGITAVKFNGVSSTFKVINSNFIAATVPQGATTGPISVTNAGGSDTTNTDFTITGSQSIKSFAPASGPVGTSVTISGQGFSSANAVKFNGQPADFSIDSDTQITATVPQDASTGPISIITSSATITSNSSFTVTQDSSAVAITDFAPSNGLAGTNVIITGKGFTGATTVKFNSSAASFFTVNSDTEITATVPANATSGPITIITANGSANSSGDFVAINNISSVSISVTNTIYNVSTDPDFVGTFTINASLKNNGKPLVAPIYFQVTELDKVDTDLNPNKPDILRSADNKNGTVGDIQTVNVSTMASGASIPVSFLIGLGSRQRFTFLASLYAGTAPTNSASIKTIKTIKTANSAPILLSRFQFTLPTFDTFDTFDTIKSRAIKVMREDSASSVSDNISLIDGAGPQSSPSIAIDANNPAHIAVAGNDFNTQSIVVKSSFDGGKSWQAATLNTRVGDIDFSHAQSARLTFNSAGELFVVYLLANVADPANAVVVSHSSDGLTFSDAQMLSLHSAEEKIFDSRPTIAADANGHIYAAWDSFDSAGGSFAIKLARAQGDDFSSAPVTVSTGQVSAPALAISARGTLYLGWDEWGFNSQTPFTTGGHLLFSSSSDGINFSSPVEIARTGIGYGIKISAMPEEGASPNLNLAVDPHREGVIYATFTDAGNGLDIFFAGSTNSGKSWRAAKRVDRDSGNADRFHSALAVDSDGSIYISYYDSERSSNGESVDVYLARSASGKKFAKSQLITTISSDDSRANSERDLTSNLGEHIGIAAERGNIAIVWTDTRQGDEDIFIELINMK